MNMDSLAVLGLLAVIIGIVGVVDLMKSRKKERSLSPETGSASPVDHLEERYDST
jgi:hypothetical protein